MKKMTLVLLSVLKIAVVFGQTDNNGNPVFISEPISEEKYDGFELTSSYYTIKDNISNKQSSVYISENPTLNDYLRFSRDRPSYFFIVHNGFSVIVLIGLMQKNEDSKTTLTYNIVNPNNGKRIEAPCNVFGEIAEKRADELQKIKADTSAKIISVPYGTMYMFNGIGYSIQPYDKLKAEIIAIAKQLIKGDNNEAIKDPVEYIEKESIGGKLDFNKVLKSTDQSFFLVNGIAYSKKDYAIYLWGKKVKMLGIESSKKATKLWEKINNATLTDPEKKALTRGYNGETK